MINNNAKNYIIKNLKNWNILLSNIKIKYAYDNSIDYHIIIIEPIKPINLYKNNKVHNKTENDFFDYFQLKFPKEKLIISNPNKYLNTENILYINY